MHYLDQSDIIRTALVCSRWRSLFVGHLERLILPPLQKMSKLNHISTYTSLQKLFIEDFDSLSAEHWESLCKLKKITSISINEKKQKQSPRTFSRIVPPVTPFTALTSLQVATLSNVKTALKPLTKLQSLCLNLQSTFFDCEWVTNLVQLTHLRILGWRDFSITKLENIGTLTTLQELWIGGSSPHIENFSSWTALKNLHTLYYVGTTASFQIDLHALRALTRLTSLILITSAKSYKFVKRLVNLNYLVLSDTNRNIDLLKQPWIMPRLKTLGLLEAPHTTEVSSINRITSPLSMPKLSTFVLCNIDLCQSTILCELTSLTHLGWKHRRMDEQQEKLEQLGMCFSLKKLSLCPPYPNFKYVSQLKIMLPKMSVEYMDTDVLRILFPLNKISMSL
jgi:hypothetical protein